MPDEDQTETTSTISERSQGLTDLADMIEKQEVGLRILPLKLGLKLTDYLDEDEQRFISQFVFYLSNEVLAVLRGAPPAGEQVEILQALAAQQDDIVRRTASKLERFALLVDDAQQQKTAAIRFTEIAMDRAVEWGDAQAKRIEVLESSVEILRRSTYIRKLRNDLTNAQVSIRAHKACIKGFKEHVPEFVISDYADDRTLTVDDLKMILTDLGVRVIDLKP